jgi:hypothetical protein
MPSELQNPDTVFNSRSSAFQITSGDTPGRPTIERLLARPRRPHRRPQPLHTGQLTLEKYFNDSFSEIAVAQYSDWTTDSIRKRGLEM